MEGAPELPVADQIRSIEQAWMDAWRRRDIEACEGILADEFLLVSALGGELFDKARWLELARGPFECESVHFDEVRVGDYGDVAVAHCLYRQVATARSRDWSGQFRLTDVWVRRGGRWQVLARHSTQLRRPS